MSGLYCLVFFVHLIRVANVEVMTEENQIEPPEDLEGDDALNKLREKIELEYAIFKKKLRLLQFERKKLDAKLEDAKLRLDEIAESDFLKGLKGTYRNCQEATASTGISTIYNVLIAASHSHVFCEALSYGGGWTVIQRRINGSTNFYRNWDDYRYGFGRTQGEFFIGLHKLHILTRSIPHELLIALDDFDDYRRFAKYDNFVVGDSRTDYRLESLGNYNGDAGDSMRTNEGQRFTTYDNDNDNFVENCAVSKGSGWWFNQCTYCNPNGKYLGRVKDLQGIYWNGFRGAVGLRQVQMMIRPV